MMTAKMHVGSAKTRVAQYSLNSTPTTTICTTSNGLELAAAAACPNVASIML
jgi:hypothetical protein